MIIGPLRVSMRVELTVKVETRTVPVEPRTSLLDCLRDGLLLTGAHAGCEHGVCGACTVLIDGTPVRSCLMFAVQADGYAITTIEGVTPGPGELSPVQDAFCETHGMQCGYCTPAMTAGLAPPTGPGRPLAVDVARYAGEWVAAVVADTRPLAEDAAELVHVDYEPLPFVLDGEEAYVPSSPRVHEAHGSNVLLDRTFVWGEVEKDFAESPHCLAFKVKWGRSSTVPIETFGVLASWDPWREILDVYASIQMPRFPDQVALALKLPGSAVRVHNDVDVGGSYGVKRGIKHAVLVSYLTRRLGFPVRLMEDRLENMRGGDAHGPERNFDIDLAFDESGVIRSMKLRALDNLGAYAGRSPFQLGKPIGAIVGPYRIQSVQYRAIAVTSNKTVQEAVRAFGQSPTNYAIERVIEEVARHRGLDRLEVRRRNLIRAEQFPYLIPSGTTYDSGDYNAVVDKGVAGTDNAALL